MADLVVFRQNKRENTEHRQWLCCVIVCMFVLGTRFMFWFWWGKCGIYDVFDVVEVSVSEGVVVLD